MENELDLNLDELDQIDRNADTKLQVKNRFQQLANDKRTLAQEKEQAVAEAQAKAAELGQALKTAEFYKTFSQVSSKHPEAINYQEQILEKVNTGLSTEDATLLILAKEGKLSSQPVERPVENVAGGSALNQMSEGDKSPNQLNENEKLQALQEMEKSGELLQALKSGLNITG